MSRQFKFIVAAIVLGLSTGAAKAADMATKAPPPTSAPANPWTEVWSGLDLTKDSDYGYAGGLVALSGNLNQDGWLFRASGGGGHYTYNRAVGVTQGVDFENGDLMVGYQTFVGRTRL